MNSAFRHALALSVLLGAACRQTSSTEESGPTFQSQTIRPSYAAWGGQGQRSEGIAGRLIAVPCAFDLLTYPAPPHPGLPADQALRLITKRAGSRFDPRAVRLFTAVAGFYPVGTLVRLSGGQLGVVMDVPADPALAAKPRVRVIQGQRRTKADYVVDLGDPGQRLSIVSSLDTAENDLNAPHFLFS
jgi:hypothetical protein